MTKHTPGPWKAQRDIRHCTNNGMLLDGSPKAWAVYGAYRTACIESTPGKAWDADIEAEANAHLIAAAPELLEHLKYAVKCAKYCHAKHPDVQKGDGVPAFLMWEAAIAKAEGGGA